MRTFLAVSMFVFGTLATCYCVKVTGSGYCLFALMPVLWFSYALLPTDPSDEEEDDEEEATNLVPGEWPWCGDSYSNLDTLRAAISEHLDLYGFEYQTNSVFVSGYVRRIPDPNHASVKGEMINCAAIPNDAEQPAE